MTFEVEGDSFFPVACVQILVYYLNDKCLRHESLVASLLNVAFQDNVYTFQRGGKNDTLFSFHVNLPVSLCLDFLFEEKMVITMCYKPYYITYYNKKSSIDANCYHLWLHQTFRKKCRHLYNIKKTKSLLYQCTIFCFGMVYMAA